MNKIEAVIAYLVEIIIGICDLRISLLPKIVIQMKNFVKKQGIYGKWYNGSKI